MRKLAVIHLMYLRGSADAATNAVGIILTGLFVLFSVLALPGLLCADEKNGAPQAASLPYDPPEAAPSWATSRWTTSDDTYINIELLVDRQPRKIDLNDVTNALHDANSHPNDSLKLLKAAYMELVYMKSHSPYDSSSDEVFDQLLSRYNSVSDPHSREFARIGFRLNANCAPRDERWISVLGQRLLNADPDDGEVIYAYAQADACQPHTATDRRSLLAYAQREARRNPGTFSTLMLYYNIYYSFYAQSGSDADRIQLVHCIKQMVALPGLTKEDREWAGIQLKIYSNSE